VDFICLEKRLVIELDGGQHNTQVIYDEKRQAWIESQDFRILRFWNTEVMRDIEAVKVVIWQALVQTRPPSSILPRKGGGDRGN
jgi:very-short-patch-repair endonuclease